MTVGESVLPPGLVLGRLGDCLPGRVAKAVVPAHDVEVLLVRRGPDVLGYLNICPHLGLPLDDLHDRLLSGDGERLVCSAHNAAFSVATGGAVRGLPAECALTPVPVTVSAAGEIVTTGNAPGRGG